MSRFERVKQWAAFSRTYHLYDAKWQNPFQSAKVVPFVTHKIPTSWFHSYIYCQQVVTKFLEGKNKPVYHPLNDTGDHVVIINSKEVKLPIKGHNILNFSKQGVTFGKRMAIQGVFSPYRLSFSFQGISHNHPVQGKTKCSQQCLAHGCMEWASVDSCMATSWQRPDPNHVEGELRLLEPACDALSGFFCAFDDQLLFIVPVFRLCTTTWVAVPSDATIWPGFTFSQGKRWKCFKQW